MRAIVPQSILAWLCHYASNASGAWSKFLALVGHERDSKETWTQRGYVARRVTIKVEIHD